MYKTALNDNRTLLHLLLKVALMGVCFLNMVACSEDDLPDHTFQPAQEAGFLWTRAEDVETHSKFLRNLGVGYSYNCVRGSYCDWKDIRCQVVDRDVLDGYAKSGGDKLYSYTPNRSASLSQQFEHSLRDYVARVSLSLDQEVDLGLYKNEKRTHKYFIENGLQEKYFFICEDKIEVYASQLNFRKLLSLAPVNERFLTRSFREAVEHIDESGVADIAVVDSFIKVWGTHVIVYSTLGGKLSVNLMNDSWRFRSTGYKSEAQMKKAFATAVENKVIDRKTQNDFGWFKHSKLSITARGGDQSTLTDLLGDYYYDGSRDFSTDGISKWRNSLVYDPDNEMNSNVEMVEMKVMPISLFAEVVSPTAAARIESAVNKDIKLVKQELGEKYFFNTSFPIRYNEAKALWRAATDKWQEQKVDTTQGMVVNIESGYRYVAIVDRETIDSIPLWVCYPIYEGKLNLACGLGVDDQNKVYKVRWFNDSTAVLSLTQDIAMDGMFYINDGAVSVRKNEKAFYAEAHPMAAIEICGGIRPNGSYVSYLNSPLTVYKEQGRFYCHCDFSSGEDLPHIPGYEPFTSEEVTKTYGFHDVYLYTGRLPRDSTYTYIYNPNEIKYVP